MPSDLALEQNPELSIDASISHDQNFKELIATFFIEFLELFLPEVAAMIDPISITFLQQEYFVDLVEGEDKIVDLLADLPSAHRAPIDPSLDLSAANVFLFRAITSTTPEAHLSDRDFFLRYPPESGRGQLQGNVSQS
jgi:hypothetical protein